MEHTEELNDLREKFSKEPALYANKLASKLNKLAEENLDANELEAASLYMVEAVQVSLEVPPDDPVKLNLVAAEGYNNMGYIYYRSEMLAEAFQHIQKASTHYFELVNLGQDEYIKEVARMTHCLAVLFEENDQREAAMHHYQKAIQIYEQIPDHASSAALFKEISSMYAREGNLNNFAHYRAIAEDEMKKADIEDLDNLEPVQSLCYIPQEEEGEEETPSFFENMKANSVLYKEGMTYDDYERELKEKKDKQ